MEKVKKRFGWKEPGMPQVIAVLLAVCAATVILATGLGPVSVPPLTTAKILLSQLPGVGKLIPQTWEPLDWNIVMGLRLPRVCLGMVVGASLAVCGVAMQALVRNNLADPFLLGVSSGAAAFATLGMLFGAFAFLGTYSLSISAFLGAAVTIVFVYAISRVRGRINITQLLLGDESASALGVNVRRLQKALVLVSSLMAGATIAVSGAIGFVGLMVPHFTRLLVGGDHKRVLPIAALLGGILVVWVDVAARMLIAPEELPVGILTAVIGGPVFIILLKKKK